MCRARFQKFLAKLKAISIPEWSETDSGKTGYDSIDAYVRNIRPKSELFGALPDSIYAISPDLDSEGAGRGPATLALPDASPKLPPGNSLSRAFKAYLAGYERQACLDNLP